MATRNAAFSQYGNCGFNTMGLQIVCWTLVSFGALDKDGDVDGDDDKKLIVRFLLSTGEIVGCFFCVFWWRVASSNGAICDRFAAFLFGWQRVSLIRL